MVNHRLYICTVYPGSRHASILKVVGFLLDDDKPLLQKIVVHKPTKKNGGWTSRVMKFQCGFFPLQLKSKEAKLPPATMFWDILGSPISETKVVFQLPVVFRCVLGVYEFHERRNMT